MIWELAIILGIFVFGGIAFLANALVDEADRTLKIKYDNEQEVQ